MCSQAPTYSPDYHSVSPAANPTPAHLLLFQSAFTLESRIDFWRGSARHESRLTQIGDRHKLGHWSRGTHAAFGVVFEEGVHINGAFPAARDAIKRRKVMRCRHFQILPTPLCPLGDPPSPAALTCPPASGRGPFRPSSFSFLSVVVLDICLYCTTHAGTVKAVYLSLRSGKAPPGKGTIDTSCPNPSPFFA